MGFWCSDRSILWDVAARGSRTICRSWWTAARAGYVALLDLQWRLGALGAKACNWSLVCCSRMHCGVFHTHTDRQLVKALHDMSSPGFCFLFLFFSGSSFKQGFFRRATTHICSECGLERLRAWEDRLVVIFSFFSQWCVLEWLRGLRWHTGAAGSGRHICMLAQRMILLGWWYLSGLEERSDTVACKVSK